MRPNTQHCSLVISPLRNLIRDQVKQWTKIGVPCVGIIGGEEVSSEIMTGALIHYVCICCYTEHPRQKKKRSDLSHLLF